MIDKKWSSFDEALAETKELINANRDLSIDDPKLPHNQYFAIELLTALEKDFAENKFALFKAMDVCHEHDILEPKWVSEAFRKGLYKICSGEEKSLDVAFGSPYPKGTNINALAKKRKLKYLVYQDVVNTLKKHPGLPKDDYLFEQVGKKFDLCKTLTSEYYYEVKKMMKPSGPGQIVFLARSKRNRCVK